MSTTWQITRRWSQPPTQLRRMFGSSVRHAMTDRCSGNNLHRRRALQLGSGYSLLRAGAGRYLSGSLGINQPLGSLRRGCGAVCNWPYCSLLLFCTIQHMQLDEGLPKTFKTIAGAGNTCQSLAFCGPLLVRLLLGLVHPFAVLLLLCLHDCHCRFATLIPKNQKETSRPSFPRGLVPWHQGRPC